MTLVVGLSGLAKRDLVAAWRASAPSAVGLLIDQGEDVKFPSRASAPSPAPAPTQFLSGCACCTGSAGLSRALSQLLRQGAASRLIIELNAGAHPAPFIDLLLAEPLATQFALEETVALVEAEHVAAQTPNRLRDWVIEQAEAADRVILRSVRHLTPPVRQAHEALLGQWSSFAPVVQWWGPGHAVPTFERLTAGRLGSAHQMMVALARRPPRWRWVWRADPYRMLDRREAIEALAPWTSEARVAVRAALRTEREWYGLRSAAWAPTVWRGENRIEIEWAAADEAEFAPRLTQLAEQLERIAKARRR